MLFLVFSCVGANASVSPVAEVSSKVAILECCVKITVLHTIQRKYVAEFDKPQAHTTPETAGKYIKIRHAFFSDGMPTPFNTLRETTHIVRIRISTSGSDAPEASE
jgi:hypothetical protein